MVSFVLKPLNLFGKIINLGLERRDLFAHGGNAAAEIVEVLDDPTVAVIHPTLIPRPIHHEGWVY